MLANSLEATCGGHEIIVTALIVIVTATVVLCTSRSELQRRRILKNNEMWCQLSGLERDLMITMTAVILITAVVILVVIVVVAV
jgi:hypothetical protein